MSTKKNKQELLRLKTAFEAEANLFQDLSLSIFYFAQEGSISGRKFKSPNHTIMLWQYYGQLGDDDSSLERLARNWSTSNHEIAGLRGSEFSCFAAIEGPRVEHFVRMAVRAGSIFSESEVHRIRMRIQKDFKTNLAHLAELSKGKPIFVGNSNPLAIWLNHVLHHLQKTHPRYLPEVKIHLDPFAASLSAIDRLLEFRKVSARPKRTGLDLMHFRVALSFPGERRHFVEDVASLLKAELGHQSIFYDKDFEAELARPNLDVVLQKIYLDGSDLVVVFLCDDYAIKEWCGLEWRAVRDIIKRRRDEKIMLLRFDKAEIPGLFGIDGYLDVSARSAADTASAILARLRSMGSSMGKGRSR